MSKPAVLYSIHSSSPNTCPSVATTSGFRGRFRKTMQKYAIVGNRRRPPSTVNRDFVLCYCPLPPRLDRFSREAGGRGGECASGEAGGALARCVLSKAALAAHTSPMGRPESGGRADSGEREGANRSFVRPSLQDLLRFPAVRDEFTKREKTDLPYFLRTLTVDFFRRPGRN